MLRNLSALIKLAWKLLLVLNQPLPPLLVPSLNTCRQMDLALIVRCIIMETHLCNPVIKIHVTIQKRFFQKLVAAKSVQHTLIQILTPWKIVSQIFVILQPNSKRSRGLVQLVQISHILTRLISLAKLRAVILKPNSFKLLANVWKNVLIHLKS